MKIDRFLGVVNTLKDEDTPLGALADATNFMVTDAGSLSRREGFTLTAAGTQITGSYGTYDHRYLFVIDNGDLFKFDGSGFTQLATGFSTAPSYWCEESSNQVFVMSQGNYGSIESGETATNLYLKAPENIQFTPGAGSISGDIMVAVQYKMGGRLSPFSDPVLYTLDAGSLMVNIPPIAGATAQVAVFSSTTGAWKLVGETANFMVINNLDPTAQMVDEMYFDVEPAPLSEVIGVTYYQARVVVAVRLSPELTRIQFSAPYQYHLFHKADDRFELPDEVTAMEVVNGRLLITCRNSIYSFTSDNKLNKLTDYGTPRGKPITKLPDSGAIIWTDRGVAKYPEFENLTEKIVSLPPGEGCSTTLYEKKGSQYLLICNDGSGEAFNAA